MTSYPRQPAPDWSASAQMSPAPADAPVEAPPTEAPPLDAPPLDAAPQDRWPDPVSNGRHHGAGDSWPDDTGTNWPGGTASAANGQNATGGTANGQAGIGYIWAAKASAAEASAAGDSWPAEASATAAADSWPAEASATADSWPAEASATADSWPAEASATAGSWPAEASPPGDIWLNEGRPEDQSDQQNGYDQAARNQAARNQAAGDRTAHDHAAGDHPRRPQLPADPELAGDMRLAMLCYFSVPFLGFLVPLVVYVLKGRRSSLARSHAAQALNLSITALLYTFCVLIVGTILALDTIGVALLIGVPLVAALWIATLVYVVRAGAAASRGDYLRIPAWICATLAR